MIRCHKKHLEVSQDEIVYLSIVSNYISGLGHLRKIRSAKGVVSNMSYKNFWLIGIIFFSVFSFVDASAQSRLKKMKFSKAGLLYETYSGDHNKSFSEGSAGYGAELGVDSGGEYLRYFVKAKVLNVTGQQTFLDDTTEVKSNYKFTEISPELGLMLYPIARKDRGLNLYIWGTGILSYNFLDLTPISSTTNNSTVAVTAYTKLKTRDQAYGYGVGSGIGFEAILSGGRKSNMFALYGEVGFRQQQTVLANQNAFQINSIQFALGVGF